VAAGDTAAHAYYKQKVMVRWRVAIRYWCERAFK